MRIRISNVARWYLLCAAMLSAGWLVFVSIVEPYTGSQRKEEESSDAVSRKDDVTHVDSTKGVYMSVVDHFLAEFSQARTMVFCEVADSRGPQLDFEISPDFTRAVQHFLPDASIETTDAFQKSVSRSIDLPPVLGEDPRWVFLDQEEIDTFSPGFIAWGRFHESYPATVGISYFSPVGFNVRGNQALVALTTFTGRHAYTAYYLSAREEGGWHVQHQWSLWSGESQLKLTNFVRGS
jgi:hypothetical protein